MSTSHPKSDSQSSVISRTHSCQTCNSLLLTRGVLPGQQIRCGRCGSISRFGTVEKVPTDRLAWRSMWLGLSSIFLLFITGLPAIYYGIKSLLRMRFSRPKTSDRVAAIVGTTMGGCFGVFFSAVVVIIGGVFAFAWMTDEESNDAKYFREQLANVCELTLPDDAQPIQYRSVFLNSQRSFRFANSPKLNEQSLFITLYIASSSVQVNRTKLSIIVNNSRRPSGSPIDEKKLQWTVGDQLCDIKKRTFQIQPRTDLDPDNATEAEAFETVEHYCGVVPTDNECFGIAITVNTTRRPMTESEVEAIWKSLRPIRKSSDP